MTFSKRWIVLLLIPCFLLGGIVGQAAIASPLTLNSVLMNNVPCTVTISGLSYTGTCSGGFVEATPSPSPTPTATPAPTPTPTPAPTPTPTPAPTATPTPAPTPAPAGSFPIVQSNRNFLTTPAAFAPFLSGVTRAGSTVVLLVASAGDGNTAFTLPSGWQRVADVTDSGLPGLHLFYYPNAPSGTTFGVFTLSAATNVSYTMTEVGANLGLDQVGYGSSATSAVGSLSVSTGATTAVSSEIVFAAFGTSQGASPQTWSAPVGFTLVNKDDTNASAESILSDQVVSLPAIYSVTQTVAPAAWTKGIIASFRVAATPAPALTPTPTPTPTPAPTPSPTPPPAPTFRIVQSNKQFLTVVSTFTPALATASRAGSTIVLLVASAGDGNTAYTLPAGWLRAADVTDGNPVGLHLFYYPNAPAGSAFGAVTLSAPTNVSYTVAEVGATLTLDKIGSGSSATTAVGSLSVSTGAPTTAANEIVLAGFGVSQGSATQNWAAPNGFTLINKDDSNRSNESNLSDVVVSATGIYTATENFSPAAWAKGIIATFKVATP